MEFSSYDLPNLRSLGITRNLRRFAGNKLPKLTYLYLGENQLSDEVVDDLVAADMKEISEIYLKGNPIMDKASARAKLQKKYPNAQIYI